MPIPLLLPSSTRRALKLLKPLILSILRPLRLLFTMADVPPPSPSPPQSSEPPFDPTKPAIPISYPIKELSDLASRSYFDSFHYPFNKSSVPLPPSTAGDLPPRRRILVCHDFKGGYVDDKWVQGGTNPNAYAIWHWHLMDVFVYFSHDLVTLPPPCWTNVAHTHGVKVLGTFITEWEKGGEICTTLLSTKESAQMYAERLAELAVALGFDGWLINMEVSLSLGQVANLKEFVSHLTQTMHSSIPGSLTIWYDSVTKDGDLNYQDQLNEKNKPFFDLCDGIFVNYTWKEDFPRLSAAFAGNRRFDVYMGIDVFGRNTYGGGQWNTSVALDLLKNDDVSAAIFAPGWVYETEQGPDFETAQNRWWGLIEQSWGVLQSYPKSLPFYSSFDQGHGFHFSIKGSQVGDGPWNNISCQGFQPILDKSMDPAQTAMGVFINFNDASYNGGGSITCKGNLRDDDSFSIRLFQGQLPLGNLPLHISYSVKSDGNSLMGLSLGFSSITNKRTSVLLASNYFSSASSLTRKFDETLIEPVRKSTREATEGMPWIMYESSIMMSGYTLIDIYLVCYMKKSDQTKSLVEEGSKFESNAAITGQYSPYFASLGHISIRNSIENMGFPPGNAWETEGQHISWVSLSNGTKTVSLNIIWKLKAASTESFMMHTIYVEKLPEQTDGNKGTIVAHREEYLGVARVESFYVSHLAVPKGITSLRFIIQVWGYDGDCQELDQSPALLLAVEG